MLISFRALARTRLQGAPRRPCMYAAHACIHAPSTTPSRPSHLPFAYPYRLSHADGAEAEGGRTRAVRSHGACAHGARTPCFTRPCPQLLLHPSCQAPGVPLQLELCPARWHALQVIRPGALRPYPQPQHGESSRRLPCFLSPGSLTMLVTRTLSVPASTPVTVLLCCCWVPSEAVVAS